jgi:hypothetical protein
MCHYFTGSTSLASTSMEIERMIKSTDTTTRSPPYLAQQDPVETLQWSAPDAYSRT